MKKTTADSTIEEFCTAQDIGPSDLGRLAGVDKMTINNYKSVTKSDHIVRHNKKTGEFEIIRKERVMCKGNIKGEIPNYGGRKRCVK